MTQAVLEMTDCRPGSQNYGGYLEHPPCVLGAVGVNKAVVRCPAKGKIFRQSRVEQCQRFLVGYRNTSCADFRIVRRIFVVTLSCCTDLPHTASQCEVRIKPRD